MTNYSLDILNSMEAYFALYEAEYDEKGVADLRLLFANDTYAIGTNIFFKGEEMIGRLFSDIISNDMAWVPLFIDVALRKRERYVFESYSVASNFHAHGQLFSPKLNQVAVIAHIRNQFVKSEAEKEQEEQRTRMMLSILPEGICYSSLIYDKSSGKPIDLHCIMVNEAFEIYEGVRVGSLQGYNFFELYPDESKMDLYMVDESLRTNEKTTYTRQVQETEL